MNYEALVLLADKKPVIGMGWEPASHMKTQEQGMKTWEAHWNSKVDSVGSGMKLELWVPQCMAWVLWIHKIPDGEDIEVHEK